MFKPSSNVEPIEVLTQPEQRRRRSVEEKLAIVRETFEPGATVSGIARRHQVNANQVFAWRKLYQDGSLSDFQNTWKGDAWRCFRRPPSHQ